MPETKETSTVVNVSDLRLPVLGRWSGGEQQLRYPVTGAPLVTVGMADADETDEAVRAAHAAFPAWRAVSPGDRARLLRRFADLVRDHVEDLARLEVAEAGHPLSAARWEAGNVADVLDYYAATPERLFGRQIPVAGGVDITFHEPLGVVAVIVPWNFPMPIAGWGFAPALAAGNTVILKPAELTPLTALRIGELALEAGLPEGVLTVLPGAGPEIGPALVTHPLVRKVCFTGSTRVGSQILTAAAGDFTRVTLELGGKNSAIIFADTDLEAAAAGIPGAAFDNAGQDCCARSRVLVQREVFDRFLELLEPVVRELPVGEPLLPDTAMGPLISAERVAAVSESCADADVLFRGSDGSALPGAGGGFWFPPTVVMPTGTEERVWTEEIFGPVVAVLPFEDEADAIRLANDTAYGLSGSVFTRDLGRALRVARAVESGNLSVNSHSSVRYWTPFGGFKQSGIGRELGPDAPHSFTEVKNVFLSHD